MLLLIGASASGKTETAKYLMEQLVNQRELSYQT